jgi:hypothetical protein
MRALCWAISGASDGQDGQDVQDEPTGNRAATSSAVAVREGGPNVCASAVELLQ